MTLLLMLPDRRVRTTASVVAVAMASMVLAMVLGLFACRRGVSSCRRNRDPTVVACVDGVPVTRQQVESFVQEPWWTPGSALLPDPRKDALARATRAALFYSEAKRRGLAPPPGAPKEAMASWVQALTTDETAKRGISRDAITDEEAARQYEDNKVFYNQVDRVDAQAIAFATPENALKVYPEAAKADEATFRALALQHSIDDKSKAKGGERAILAVGDEDHTMLKVVLTAPRPGTVLGPFKASDGLWWILRIKAVPIEHAKPFDDTMKLAMKNVLVDLRRKRALDELEASLRTRAKIEVFEELTTVAVPKPN